MTYAPATLLDTRRYLVAQDKAAPTLEVTEVGIVGDTSHVIEGTGYHLGKDQLKFSKNPYSARTARDKAGLADPEIANAACAIDIDDDWDYMRQFFPWCVEECRASAPDTLDIRELIYSPDGTNVFRWDRENGVRSLPQPSTQYSHRTHGHISKYRDSTRRSLTPLFERYYREVVDGGGPTEGDDTLHCKFGDGEKPLPPDEKVREMQKNGVACGYDLSGTGGADGRYGAGTAAMLVALVPAAAGDGKVYNADVRTALQKLLRETEFKAYLAANPPAGGTLPGTVTAVIPEHELTVDVDITVPKQTVTLILVKPPQT
jgi:hypothetical protein